MELREQLQQPTLADRVGDVTHASALLRRLRRLSGCAATDLPAWLLRCAVERGASHYRRSFDPTLPADQPSLTCEEVGVARRVAPALEPWRTLRDKLPCRHRVRLDALPHWSRFVLQTGYTRTGRGQH